MIGTFAVLFYRLIGGIENRAAGCILAKQGTLRSAQHLHALQVDVVEYRAVRARHIDAIYIQAHAGVEVDPGVAGADAANIDIAAASGAITGIHIDVGHYPGEV